MDIQELNRQLSYLEETKNLMKQALIDKGQPVDDNTTFREYIDNMDTLIDTTDANAAASEVGEDKTAYVDGNKVTGNVPIYDENTYLSLPKNYNVNASTPAMQYDFILPNMPVANSGYLITNKGTLIDISTLPEDITGKTIFISKNYYNFSGEQYWSCTLIVAPANSLIKGYYHDSTYDIKATTSDSSSFVNMDMWRTENLNDEPDINAVSWTRHSTEVNYVTLGGKDGYGEWYCSSNLWSGSNINPPSEMYNGGASYRYLQKVDMKDKTALTKANTKVYVPIHTSEILNAEGITANKIKVGESVLGLDGTFTNDGNVTASDIGMNKIAYANGQQVVGTIPIVEANDYALLNRTQSLNSGDMPIMERTYKNINDGTVSELVMSDGTKLDISTLPENVDNKNIFIVYGKNSYNVYWWFLFITDIDNSICLASHDYTYAVVCKNKGNRATNKDMVYYRGNTPYVEGVPFNINDVNWGNQIVWDKSTGVELNLSQQGLTVFATDTVYRGQFGSYGTEQFSGSMDFRYYQDNKIGISPNSGLVQNSSQLFKETSHALVPINTKNIVGQENITADKIKSGETILGITGTFTNDGNVTAGDIGSGKIAYANGQKITGNVPLVEADNYIMLNKTENFPGGSPYSVNSLHYNVNDGTVSEIMFSNGQKLDLSTLPEDITGKNVFIYYGTDTSFDRWGLFITDMDSTIGLYSHDDTYAVTCLDKATRRTSRDISYYMGANSKTGNIDINNVNWGTKTVWDKRYLIEIYLKKGYYNVYATNDVYWGQFGNYDYPVFAGSSRYIYYQDNYLKNNGVATTQVLSLLAKTNSHICAAINTGELITKENIIADKIKAGETILGVLGKSSVVDTDDATASNSDLVDGKTAYVNGNKITGTITDKRNNNTRVVGADVTGSDQYRVTLEGTGNSTPEIINSSTTVKCEIANNLLATGIGLTADKIKQGVTIIGVTGTYSDAMKSYASVTAMNNDIANISADEVVQVDDGTSIEYYIEDNGTMVKLVKDTNP